MSLTKKEIDELRALKTLPDSDNIRWKEVIKKKLLNNKKLIHVLNNDKLEKINAEPDEYFGVNIFPYYMIDETQSDVKNFICFEVQFSEVSKHNKIIKVGQIIFYIMCEKKNILDKDTYLPRHDLLAAIITEEFNWTNHFGMQCHLISDKPSVTDNDYPARTLIFVLETPNSIVKSENKIPRVANYETGA